MESTKKISKALLNASRDGKTKDILELISKGANINFKDSEGHTPLMLACRHDHIETVLELISKGADVNSKNILGDTPLHYASLCEGEEVFIAVVSNVSHINSKNANGDTPLHYASARGKFKNVCMLILNGSDVNIKNNKGMTPICLASHFGNIQSALTLIAYGANSYEIKADLWQLRSLTMHQAAAQGGFTSRMIELLGEHPSSLSQDAPEVLAALAKHHEKLDTAAAIQAFIAAQAIDSMLKIESPNAAFPRV